jgi:hypothetical protein
VQRKLLSKTDYLSQRATFAVVMLLSSHEFYPG